MLLLFKFSPGSSRDQWGTPIRETNKPCGGKLKTSNPSTLDGAAILFWERISTEYIIYMEMSLPFLTTVPLPAPLSEDSLSVWGTKKRSNILSPYINFMEKRTKQWTCVYWFYNTAHYLEAAGLTEHWRGLWLADNTFLCGVIVMFDDVLSMLSQRSTYGAMSLIARRHRSRNQEKITFFFFLNCHFQGSTMLLVTETLHPHGLEVLIPRRVRWDASIKAHSKIPTKFKITLTIWIIWAHTGRSVGRRKELIHE